MLVATLIRVNIAEVNAQVTVLVEVIVIQSCFTVCHRVLNIKLILVYHQMMAILLTIFFFCNRLVDIRLVCFALVRRSRIIQFFSFVKQVDDRK